MTDDCFNFNTGKYIIPIHPLERLKTFRTNIKDAIAMSDLAELDEIVEFLEQIEENR